MRKVLATVSLATLAAAFSATAQASYVTISSTQIQAGQSVTLDFTGLPQAQYSIDQSEYRVPPGGSLSWMGLDFETSTYQHVDAPGSEQGTYDAYVEACSQFLSCTSRGSVSELISVTYDHPGDYTLDYVYSQSATWFGTYVVYDANGEMVSGGHYLGQRQCAWRYCLRERNVRSKGFGNPRTLDVGVADHRAVRRRVSRAH